MRLSPAQIIALTRRRDRKLQAAELDAMGIPYSWGLRNDLVVLQSAVDAVLMPEGRQSERDDFEYVPLN